MYIQLRDGSVSRPINMVTKFLTSFGLFGVNLKEPNI